MKFFKFEKDYDSRWYVILPEWEGDRSELEMVCGADVMLDILSQGEDRAYMRISEEEVDDIKFTLYFDREEGGGAWYNLKSEYYNFDVWLCHVTKFVYGRVPKILYCS